jgi:hypothetical protein
VGEGRLHLGPTAIRFEGEDEAGAAVTREIRYDEVRSIRLVDDPAAPTLVLERATGDVAIRSVATRAGLLQELVSSLVETGFGKQRRAVVVVPLREGAAEQVRALAAAGPPFDPEEAALLRHELFVTDAEAVFVFDAVSGVALEALSARIDVWAAAAAWRDLVAGPPRLAAIAYSWEASGAVSGPGLGL